MEYPKSPTEAVDILEAMHARAVSALIAAVKRFSEGGAPPSTEERALFRHGRAGIVLREQCVRAIQQPNRSRRYDDRLFLLGFFLCGLFLRGFFLRGLFLRGLLLRGLLLRGLLLRGLFLRGLLLRGLLLRGLFLRGLFLNRLLQNRLFDHVQLTDGSGCC